MNSTKGILLCALLCGIGQPASAQLQPGKEKHPVGLPGVVPGPLPPVPNVTFSVSPNQPLNYPKNQFQALPDEHQTFVPMPETDPAYRQQSYNVIAAMYENKNGKNYGWTFLLHTDNLQTFSLLPGAGDPAHGNAIFWPPHDILEGPSGCSQGGITHFDDQYAAPGSVVRDPTQPPGSMIMVYEAEIHCPWSKGGGGVGWISVGVAHSRRAMGANVRPAAVWPEPVAAPGYENNWLDYGNGRYAALTIPGLPKKSGEYTEFYGNALPSAFVDDVVPSVDKFIYVLYSFTASLGRNGDGKVHIARARMGGREPDNTHAKLQFEKWYHNGWNAPGIQTSMDTMRDDGLDPAGCDGVASFNSNAQIVYNDALGLYMLLYACHRLDCSTTPCKRTSVSWFYRTSRDLSTQIWGAPHLIENSTYPITTTTDAKGNPHYHENGDYPTFISPGHAPGHIGLTGYVFLLNGDPLGDRAFARRWFTIKTEEPPLRDPHNINKPRE